MNDTFIVWPVLIFFIVFYSLFLFLPITIYFFYKFKKASKETDPYKKYGVMLYFRFTSFKGVMIPFAIFMFTTPIPCLIFYYVIKSKLNKWRNSPRVSPATGLPMRKLTENEEDNFLQTGQLKEEELGSLDHDVWVSEKEGDFLILSYGTEYSIYNVCPKCNHRTTEVKNNVTTKEPTYTKKGKGIRTEYCLNCLETSEIEFDIPVLVDDDDNTNWNSNSSSTSSSGSSNSGGTWGGGNSGSGGAGSNW